MAVNEWLRPGPQAVEDGREIRCPSVVQSERFHASKMSKNLACGSYFTHTVTRFVTSLDSVACNSRRANVRADVHCMRPLGLGSR